MATAREIRRRIRSVRNIRQITNALEAVSASKVRRAQDAVTATRPYAQKARELLASVASLAGGETRHPLLTKRSEVKNIGLLIISSDGGLAGAFNTNVGRHALDYARESGKPVSYITIGRKGRDFIYRRGGKVVADFSGLPSRPTLLDTTGATRALTDSFLNGEVDEVYLVYTEFISRAVQRPTIKKLLPLVAEDLLTDTSTSGPRPAYDFEPGPQEILDTLLPRLTEMQVYQAVLESIASEHAARMVAMRNATDAATDLIASYTLSYNKARQQSITNELLDISGGAEALAQATRAEQRLQ
jgi:F-type H+-transporting ATPase subunit gamma